MNDKVTPIKSETKTDHLTSEDLDQIKGTNVRIKDEQQPDPRNAAPMRELYANRYRRTGLRDILFERFPTYWKKVEGLGEPDVCGNPVEQAFNAQLAHHLAHHARTVLFKDDENIKAKLIKVEIAESNLATIFTDLANNGVHRLDV